MQVEKQVEGCKGHVHALCSCARCRPILPTPLDVAKGVSSLLASEKKLPRWCWWSVLSLSFFSSFRSGFPFGLVLSFEVVFETGTSRLKPGNEKRMEDRRPTTVRPTKVRTTFDERHRSTMAEAEGTPPKGAVLMSASKYIARSCKDVNKTFMECKAKDLNPSACLKEGEAVTECLLKLYDANSANAARRPEKARCTNEVAAKRSFSIRQEV